MSNALLKRLDQIIRFLNISGAKTVVVKIPVLLTPVEGSIECVSTVTTEARAAADEILNAVGVTDGDTVIEILRYYQGTKTNGHEEQEPAPTAELVSVT